MGDHLTGEKTSTGFSSPWNSTRVARKRSRARAHMQSGWRTGLWRADGGLLHMNCSRLDTYDYKNIWSEKAPKVFVAGARASNREMVRNQPERSEINAGYVRPENGGKISRFLLLDFYDWALI